MGHTRPLPPSFKGNPELMKWYDETPKWKMAEALREYAIMAVGDEELALANNYYFYHENGLIWWVNRIT